MKIEIISERRYDEPKLTMPKALKGIKKAGTVHYSKAACPVYLTADAAYIKHRDYFSPMIPFQEAEEQGLIAASKWRKKFIYKDNFGGIVLRCEAWIRIPYSLMEAIQQSCLIPYIGLTMEMERTLGLQEGQLCNYDWEHMFEELYKICKM